MSEQTAAAIADLIACQEGWACKTIMGAHLDASDDLEDHVDVPANSPRTRDREKAMSLLDESLDISSELGMRPLMERVISRQDILPV